MIDKHSTRARDIFAIESQVPDSHDAKNSHEVPSEILEKLTPMQAQVLNYFLQGLNHNKIMEVIGKNLSAVKAHFHRMYLALGIDSQEQLMFEILGDIDPRGFKKFARRFDLTEDQARVLGLILKGNSHVETAELLGIHTNSVENHLHNIREKTGMTKHTAQIFLFVHNWIKQNTSGPNATPPSPVDKPAPSAP